MKSEYITIFLDNKIYSQRTPTSKFIEFSLDGIKQNSFEELPIQIKEMVDIAKDMEQNPDKYFTYKEKDGEIEITSIKYIDSPYIRIPEFIENLPVTTLGSYISMGLRNNIEQIQLPDTLQYFNNNTFNGLASLKHINIPKNITTIPTYCFNNCTNLTTINLEYIKRIEANAFKNCYALKELNLKNISVLLPFAFQDCKNLKKITLQGTIRGIGRYCFNGCDSLKEINLPDSIEIIHDYAFNNCALTSFTAPKKLNIIGVSAFANNKLTSLNLNENLRHIYKNAFEGNKISSFKVPETISYHPDAFANQQITDLER